MTIDIILPKPHPAQQKVLDSKARFRTLLCGRRFGKTLISMVIAIQHMLEGKAVAYCTPEFSLGKDFFREILKYLPSTIIRVDNKSELYIELITGGSLKFFSGQALDSFRGRSYDLAIIDESSYITELKDQWSASIRPTLTDRKGKAIFISTPKGKEFTYSLFMKGLDPLEEEYESFHFPSSANPFLPPEELEDAKKQVSELIWKQEYLAIAGENQANPIGTDNINKNILTELSNEETVVFGIDLAKYSDYTVITGIDVNGHMTYFDRFKLPWHLTQDRIKNLPEGILKVVDATGIGDVVTEGLQLVCPNILGFKFTSESKPRIIYELIKDIEQGNIKYNQITADEMHTFEYKYSSTGHITFNAIGGYNDDCIAALALANHHKNQALQSKGWKLHFI